MGATTSSRMPLWSSKDIKATLNKFRTPCGTREWGFDVFYCPIDLFESLADITALYKSKPESQEISPDLMEQAILFGLDVKKGDASANSSPRQHMAEVWRLGILLYLIRLFRVPGDIFDIVSLHSSIFRHARAIPWRTGWSYSISWPLFQAGLLLPRADTQTRIWLRKELWKNFRALGCIHQKLAVEVLEQVWRLDKGRLHDRFRAGIVPLKLIL